MRRKRKKIIQIAAETLVEEGSSPTGAVPDGVEISKDGQRLFVTNRDDGTVSIIQIASGESSLLNTGGKPGLINSNRDNSLVYVSNFDFNTMRVIDTSPGLISYNIDNLDDSEGAQSVSKATSQITISMRCTRI